MGRNGKLRKQRGLVKWFMLNERGCLFVLEQARYLYSVPRGRETRITGEGGVGRVRG